MQLGKSEALGMLDDHDRRLRNIDADLDDGCRDQYLRRTLRESGHRFILVTAFHPAVNEADSAAEDVSQMGKALLRGSNVKLLAFLNERADPEGAGAPREGALQPLDQLVHAIERQGAGVNRPPSRGLFAQIGNIHVAEIGQHQAARDGRRGHDENVGRLALIAEGETLMDAETMLFIDNGKTEIAKGNAFLKQGMGPDHNVNRSIGKTSKYLLARRAFAAASQKRKAQPRCFTILAECLMVLAGENLGRRHERR